MQGGRIESRVAAHFWLRLRRAPHGRLGRFAWPAVIDRLGARGRWQELREAFALERDRGLAYLSVPIALGLGAAAYFVAPREPPAWLTLLVLASAFSAVAGLRSRTNLRGMALAVALLVSGFAAAQFETVRASTKMLGAEVTTRLTGRVVAVEPMPNGRTRLTLDVVGTERPQLRFAPDRVRVSLRGSAPEIRAGAVVQGLARLMPPSGPVRPGGYDFSFQSFFDGIGANGFFMGRIEVLEPGGNPLRLVEQVENARSVMAARIKEQVGGTAGEVAAALVVGIRAGIPEPVNESLRVTGLAHVLSISGLHMALVAASVMFAVRGALALFPNFASRRPIKKYAAGAALVVISAYLFISGAEVAAQRSYLMLAVVLLAVIFDRPALTMRNLATSAILILLWSPHEIMGPSFQMSFAATAALIGAFEVWKERRRQRAGGTAPQGWARWLKIMAGALVGLAATSLVAGLATLVFGAYHFHRLSPLGLPANLLAMPVISLVVMPAALAGTLTMPLGLDPPFWLLVRFGLDLMLSISERLAAVSPGGLVGTLGGETVLAASAAILLISVLTTRLRWIAVIPVFLTMVGVGLRSPPDILVSEDGHLAAIRPDADVLAVSLEKPDRFTVGIWQRAAATASVLTPQVDEGQELFTADLPASERQGTGFRCRPGLCWATHPTGVRLVIAQHLTDLGNACATARIVVVTDPTVRKPCPRMLPGQLVVTGRDLARRGSLELRVSEHDGAAGLLRPAFAIGTADRPWHAHRRFSRAARGLGIRVPERASRSKPDS